MNATVQMPTKVLAVLRMFAARANGVKERHNAEQAIAAVTELLEAAADSGDLIHSWRETGIQPSLRELVTANERLALAIAGAGGPK